MYSTGAKMLPPVTVEYKPLKAHGPKRGPKVEGMIKDGRTKIGPRPNLKYPDGTVGIRDCKYFP